MKRRLKLSAIAPRKRPWLKLCSPCNHRAYDAGVKAETDGIEVCEPCAKAIDQYNVDIVNWNRRVERNRRKRERRAQAAR